MKTLTDREFAEWVDAIERNEDIPSSLPAEDAADLRLAQRLLDHRVVSPPNRLKNARYRLSPSTWRRPLQWRSLAVALLGVLLLAIMVITLEAEVWAPPDPDVVIFEGDRYGLGAFMEVVKEQNLTETMIFFLDEDENGQQVYYAFRNLKAAQPFIEERYGEPSSDDR